MVTKKPPPGPNEGDKQPKAKQHALQQQEEDLKAVEAFEQGGLDPDSVEHLQPEPQEHPANKKPRAEEPGSGSHPPTQPAGCE